MDIAAPHAMLFGALVAWGKVAIGIGTLLGLLFRPAAFCGGLLSLIFFLSASWSVRPYFYGADIVFLFGWLTLYLAGPAGTGLPALDTWLWPWWRGELAAPPRSVTQARVQDGPRQGPTRRQLLGSATAGILGALAVLLFRARVRSADDDSRTGESRPEDTGQAVAAASSVMAMPTATAQPTAVPSTTSSQPRATTAAVMPPTQAPSSTPVPTVQPTPTSPLPAGLVIAQTSAVPPNSAVSFRAPNSYQSGVLVHLASGQFVAFDSACTHAGCPVSYDPASQLLRCPCHGAAFDPASAGAVVQRPARRPLASLPIIVDDASGTIRLQQ